MITSDRSRSTISRAIPRRQPRFFNRNASDKRLHTRARRRSGQRLRDSTQVQAVIASSDSLQFGQKVKKRGNIHLGNNEQLTSCEFRQDFRISSTWSCAKPLRVVIFPLIVTILAAYSASWAFTDSPGWPVNK